MDSSGSVTPQYRQVLLSDEELAYGLNVRPDLPKLTEEQQATWVEVPWEPIAQLRVEPEALTERYELTFQDTVDGLDMLRLAVLGLDTGLRIAFKRHRGAPGGTTVDILPSQLHHGAVTPDMLDRVMDTSQDDVLRQIMNCMALQTSDFTWVRPKTATQSSS